LKTKFSKTACLAIIQQDILVKEQINITTPFYDEISKYSQSILANISSTKGIIDITIKPKILLLPVLIELYK
jgi:competence transcription factor ComK